jgi:hypothetical protein
MRTDCRACGKSEFEKIVDLGALPLAGGFLEGPGEIAREQRYPLAIFVCASCGLVQILDPVEPEVLFQGYSFSSSTIKPLVDHFDSYAQWLVTRLNPGLVVEFGCNDGVLLEPLKRRGVKAVGVDISENISEIGRSRNLDVRAGYFDPEMARTILQDYGPADVVTGSNAFAHNDQPELILEGAQILLADTGHLCLEFMYAGDLLEQLQWDTLYHEHLTFYSLGTIETLLNRYGFYVVDAERLPMHGGSLRLTAARKPGLRGDRVESLADYETHTRLNVAQTWSEFGSRSMRKIRIVADVIGTLAAKRSIWAYGAAGKATMWVNAAGMDYLGAVVDASPLRAGKLMPGTHTPIVLPDELRRTPPDHIFVTAWNYADLIRSKEAWFTGTWSSPLPDLRFF